MKSIKTPCANVSFIEDSTDIICIEYYNQNMTMEEAKEHIAMMKEYLVTNERLLALSDIRLLKRGIPKKVRDYSSSEEGLRQCRGVAILVYGAFSKFLAKLVIKFNSTPVPFEVFNKKDEAVEWLQQLNAKQRANNDPLIQLPY